MLCECEQERAAILEADAHMSRDDAERLVMQWRASGLPARCDKCDRSSAFSVIKAVCPFSLALSKDDTWDMDR